MDSCPDIQLSSQPAGSSGSFGSLGLSGGVSILHPLKKCPILFSKAYRACDQCRGTSEGYVDRFFLAMSEIQLVVGCDGLCILACLVVFCFVWPCRKSKMLMMKEEPNLFGAANNANTNPPPYSPY